MQAPRGLLFFRLSSAALVLTAATFYQSQLTSPLGDASATARRAVYERYESVLRLLEANRPAAAAELLESFPDTELGIHNALLRDHFADYSPAMLYLRIGKLLARHATAAARGGSERQAQLLVETGALLERRLEAGKNHDESLAEQAQRLQVARLLRKLTQRGRAFVALPHSS